ncbi:hypothetical protein, partial [Streptomyces sparsus]
ADAAGPEGPVPADVEQVLRRIADEAGAPEATTAVTAEDASAIARVMRNNLRIAPGFTPEVYRGEVLFFDATGDAADPGDPALAPAKHEGWRRHVDGTLTVHPVPCGHYEMTEPEPLARIAELLAPHLGLDPA